MNNQVERANSIKKEWAEYITKWEKAHGRHFSWRKNRTPYRILIAEVLLKRTTSTAAIRLYDKFLEKYPDINSLNNASTEELKLILLPIGLYNQRAKQLKQIAEYAKKEFGGKLPQEYELLLKIPGVGDYTASAIICFSYGKDKSIVDSNVERILSRAFDVDGKVLKALAEILVSSNEPDVYNYGMLDLGAIICHYHSPKCSKCPVKIFCKTLLLKQ